MQPEPIEGQPEIEYPCQWEFKVIGTDEAALRRAIEEIVGDRPHELTFSHRSRGGKYSSLRLSVHVDDEECRNAIFVALRERDEVATLL